MQGRGRSEQGHGRWVPVRSEVLARGTQSSSVGCRMAFSFYGMSYGVDSGSGQKTRQCTDDGKSGVSKSDESGSLSCQTDICDGQRSVTRAQG